jgi:hypothetical protein
MTSFAKLAATTAVALGAAVTSQAVPAAAPSQVLVSFEQTGGFAAIERGLSVRRSGAVVSDGLPVKVKQLSPARLRMLRGVLAGAQFATLRDKYESDEPIADGFVYRIAYAGRRVQIEQGARLPVRLDRAFTALRSLTH